jgi:hypothetical protein
MTLLNGLLLFIGIPGAIAIGVIIIRRAHRIKYINDIILFENAVRSLPVVRKNFDMLSERLDDLDRHNVDRKRTTEAHMEFIKKYWKYIK